MTPRERWLAVLNGDRPDRLLMDYWGTDDATAKLVEHLRCADEWEMYKKLHIDRVVFLTPPGLGGASPGGRRQNGNRHTNGTQIGKESGPTCINRIVIRSSFEKHLHLLEAVWFLG